MGSTLILSSKLLIEMFLVKVLKFEDEGSKQKVLEFLFLSAL